MPSRKPVESSLASVEPSRNTRQSTQKVNTIEASVALIVNIRSSPRSRGRGSFERKRIHSRRRLMAPYGQAYPHR